MRNVDRYYRILELEPGASPEEVRQGYRDLTVVWHPDRFVHYPRLQKKAQEKIKQINEAHEQLRSLLSPVKATASVPQPQYKPSRPQSSSPTARNSHRQRVSRATEADYKRALEDYIQTIRHRNNDIQTWLD